MDYRETIAHFAAVLTTNPKSSFFETYLRPGPQVGHGGSGFSATTMLGAPITVSKTPTASHFKIVFTA